METDVCSLDIRMSRQMRQRLQVQADRERRKISALARLILERWLEKQEEGQRYESAGSPGVRGQQSERIAEKG